jgi:hypothetical protein
MHPHACSPRIDWIQMLEDLDFLAPEPDLLLSLTQGGL